MAYKLSKNCCNKQAGYCICYKCEMCGRKFDENCFLIIEKKDSRITKLKKRHKQKSKSKRKIKIAFFVFFYILYVLGVCFMEYRMFEPQLNSIMTIIGFIGIIIMFIKLKKFCFCCRGRRH